MKKEFDSQDSPHLCKLNFFNIYEDLRKYRKYYRTVYKLGSIACTLNPEGRCLSSCFFFQNLRK